MDGVLNIELVLLKSTSQCQLPGLNKKLLLNVKYFAEQQQVTSQNAMYCILVAIGSLLILA